MHWDHEETIFLASRVMTMWEFLQIMRLLPGDEPCHKDSSALGCMLHINLMHPLVWEVKGM